MSTYLSQEEYQALKTGVDIPADEYEKAALAADIVINSQIGISANMAKPPDAVRKAAAYQTAYIYAHGGAAAMGGPEITRESLGDYQWSGTSSAGGERDLRLHPLVLPLLLRAGLLHRGGQYGR